MKHNQQEVVKTADVMYHLFVLLRIVDIPFSEGKSVSTTTSEKVITLKVRKDIQHW